MLSRRNLREIGHEEKSLADTEQQSQPIVAQLSILGHDQDLFKKGVHRTPEAGQGPADPGVIPAFQGLGHLGLHQFRGLIQDVLFPILEEGGINFGGLGGLGDIDDPFKGQGQGGKFRALADRGQGLDLVRGVHHVPAARGQAPR